MGGFAYHHCINIQRGHICRPYHFAQQIAQQRGWVTGAADLRSGHVQWPLWKLLGCFSPRMRALGSMEYVWRTPHRLDNRRLLALIGQEPRTDWQQSVAQTVELLFPAPVASPMLAPAPMELELPAARPQQRVDAE